MSNPSETPTTRDVYREANADTITLLSNSSLLLVRQVEQSRTTKLLDDYARLEKVLDSGMKRGQIDKLLHPELRALLRSLTDNLFGTGTR